MKRAKQTTIIIETVNDYLRNNHITRNGEIIYTGTKEECITILQEDTTGELEMYPETARI